MVDVMDCPTTDRQTRPLRLCCFSAFIYPVMSGRNMNIGGAERDLYTLVKELARTPLIHVEIITRTDEITSPMQIQGIILKPVRPSMAKPDSSMLWQRLGMMTYYIRLLWAFLTTPADLFFVKLASVEACLLWFAATMRRLPVIFRIEHDWETSRNEAAQNLFMGNALLAGIFFFCLKRMDWIICQTKLQAQQLQEKYGLTATLIHNAHEMPSGKPPSVCERHHVLWVGRGHPMKQAEVYLDLARRLPERQFVMIMSVVPGYEDYHSSIRSQAALLPNLTFVPGLSPDETVDYYQKERIFVLTSGAEGFSNAVIEAMKHATPVVSYCLNPDSIFQPLKEKDDVARNDEEPCPDMQPAIGWCARGNPDAMAEQIDELFRNDSLWQKSSELARSHAMQHYDVKSIAMQYMTLFQELSKR